MPLRHRRRCDRHCRWYAAAVPTGRGLGAAL